MMEIAICYQSATETRAPQASQVILQISSDACVFCRPLKKHMSSNIGNKFEIVVWIGRS